MNTVYYDHLSFFFHFWRLLTPDKKKIFFILIHNLLEILEGNFNKIEVKRKLILLSVTDGVTDWINKKTKWQTSVVDEKKIHKI